MEYATHPRTGHASSDGGLRKPTSGGEFLETCSGEAGWPLLTGLDGLRINAYDECVFGTMLARRDGGNQAFRGRGRRPHAMQGKAEFARYFFLRIGGQIVPEAMGKPERLHHEEQEHQGKPDQSAMWNHSVSSRF